ALRRPPGDGPEEDQTFHQFRAGSSEAACRDRAPRMSNDGDTLHAAMRADPAHHLFDLPTGAIRHSQRRVVLGWFRHFRISIGLTEAVEVETPHIVAGRAQLVAPGSTIEAMSDRQSRRESATMNIK